MKSPTLLTVFAFLFLIQFGAAVYQLDDDILRRIVMLENRVSEQDKTNQILAEKLEEKLKEVMELREVIETRCNKIDFDIENLDERVTKLEDPSEYSNSNMDSPDNIFKPEIFQIQNTNTSDITRTTSHQTDKVINGRRNLPTTEVPADILYRRQLESPVGFTAVLENKPDCKIPHVSVNQVIKFNKILTNVGNHYNIHTGVFSVPVEGLYMFHFTTTTGWQEEKLWARLMVDDVPQTAGVAGSYHFGQDLQGGNHALLHLQAAQVVWVEVFTINDVHIYACNGFSSFTGVLLHEN